MSTNINHSTSCTATLACDNHCYLSPYWPIELFQVFWHDMSPYLIRDLLIPSSKMHLPPPHFLHLTLPDWHKENYLANRQTLSFSHFCNQFFLDTAFYSRKPFTIPLHGVQHLALTNSANFFQILKCGCSILSDPISKWKELESCATSQIKALEKKLVVHI